MDNNPTVSSTPRPRRHRRTRRTPSGVASAASTRTSAATFRPKADEAPQTRPTPQITDELALKLAIVLGVSPLNRPPTCHGYANDCSCEECRARVQHLSRRSADVHQPWDAWA